MIKNTNTTLTKFFASLAKLCGFFILIISIHVPFANAASSQWQDLGGGKVRLLAHLDPATNKVAGVIEVKLEEGWSTYWRYPGSSGIPPRFDFSKSLAYTSDQVKFPVPQLITQDYGTYAGYKEKVMFPFEGELLATGSAEINLDLLIGVCSEVCIPATAKLNIKNSQLFQSDPKVVQAVSFANIAIPAKRNANDILISREQVDEKTLHVKIKHEKSFGKPSLFVEGPTNWYLLPAELILQEEDFALFKLDVSQAPKGTDILAHQLRYTIVTGTSGVEIQR